MESVNPWTHQGSRIGVRRFRVFVKVFSVIEILGIKNVSSWSHIIELWFWQVVWMALRDPTVQCTQPLMSFLSEHLVHFLLNHVKSIQNNVLKLVIVIVHLLNTIFILPHVHFLIVSRFNTKRLFDVRNFFWRHQTYEFWHFCINFSNWIKISLRRLT
jgi:hypothetical protein